VCGYLFIPYFLLTNPHLKARLKAKFDEKGERYNKIIFSWGEETGE